MHSNAVNIDENTAILFLAFALNEFFITNYDFKLYADTKPEFPLRGMTLKFKKDNRYFSLYPYEFSLKVWNNQARFEELLDNVEHNLKNMPSIDDILN